MKMLNRMSVAITQKSRYGDVAFVNPDKKRLYSLLHTTTPSGLILSLHQEQGERNTSDCGGDKQVLLVSPFLH